MRNPFLTNAKSAKLKLRKTHVIDKSWKTLTERGEIGPKRLSRQNENKGNVEV